MAPRRVTRIAIFAALVALLWLLAACGGGTAEAEPAAVAEADSAAATPAAPVATETLAPTETLPPTETPTPAPSETPAPTGTPAPSPTPTAAPWPSVNNVPVDQFMVLTDETVAHVREIWAAGQARGRNPAYFSKLGDSTTLTPLLLGRFDEPGLNLGDYAYLQPTVDHYAGVWDEFGVAARYGLHSWSIFDPMWADKEWCQPNETVLDCEFRLNNPSVLIIRLGSNDAGSPDGFAYNIRKAVEYAVEQGVIPVIATKADRFEGEDNINNIRMREIAAQYNVPLWDFDIIAGTLPERGLDTDGIHMKYYTENDYSNPAALQSGHAVQDLTGLMMLDAIRQIVSGG